MRKTILALTLAAIAVPTVPAMAEPNRYGDRYERRSDRASGYDRYGRYNEPRRLSRNDRVWRGRDGRNYCRRENGTTGLIIGGAAGALLGREIDGGYNRATGTILGAAAGALLGREVDRGGSRGRCR